MCAFAATCRSRLSFRSRPPLWMDFSADAPTNLRLDQRNVKLGKARIDHYHRLEELIKDESDLTLPSKPSPHLHFILLPKLNFDGKVRSKLLVPAPSGMRHVRCSVASPIRCALPL